VKLERTPVPGRFVPRSKPSDRTPPVQKPKPKSGIGGGEIVNPWE
jgi:hypothetical protein